VYFTAVVQGGTGYHNFYKLDTNTKVLTDYGIDGPGLGSTDLNLKTTLSADNTRAYFNNDGYVFSIDTASDTVFAALTDPGCCYGDYDLTLSKNQTQFEATSYLYDSNLNAESFLTLNDRETQNISYVYGTKLSPDGSLLFQPSTNGVDIFDGHLGTLRHRLVLPFSLSSNYDALVGDGKDNVLLAITGTSGNGVAVLDLTPFSEPTPLPYASALTTRRNVSELRSPGSTNIVTPNGRPEVIANPGTLRSRAIPHVTNAKPMPANNLP
jgi:hypothetical protein